MRRRSLALFIDQKSSSICAPLQKLRRTKRKKIAYRSCLTKSKNARSIAVSAIRPVTCCPGNAELETAAHRDDAQLLSSEKITAGTSAAKDKSIDER